MIKKRIQNIKAKLILEQPYFGSIASSLEPVLNENIQAYQTINNKFEYNDDFINTLDDDELMFTLTNCSMHYALDYNNRQENRITWLWKLANDYAINSLLVKNNLKKPLISNYDIRFDNLNAEKIYNILQDEIENKQDLKQNIEHIKYQNKEEKINDDLNEQNAQKLNKAKEYGDLPLGIEILVPNIYDGKINWKDELYEVIEHAVKFDYKLFPANKKFLHLGVALPSLSGTMAKIVIAIDSSGSIDDKLLGLFLGEVESIMNMFSNFEIDLIIADAKVQEHTVLYPGDKINKTIKGGGGTNFLETFNYIEQNIQNINLFLYFTDGAGKFPISKYSFETIWVLSNDEVVDIPFGRVITLK